MVIKHNISAMNAHRNTIVNNAQTARSLEKLSSGYRVNRAADDAAGLAISEKMRSQIRGLGMAEMNASNGINLIQTAEGGLNETHAILQRMRELAVQSSNGTYHDNVDRENLTKEIQALKSEIDRIAASTHYNGINLLDGTLGGAFGINMPGVTLNGNDYEMGSYASLCKFLGALGFSTNEVGGALAYPAEITSHCSGFDGESATLLITSSNVTGDRTQVALQVGDKTYIGAYSTSPATVTTANNTTITVDARVYVFCDEEGKAVATMTNYDGNYTNPRQLATGKSSGVISGIKLAIAPTATELIGTPAPSVRLGESHPLYGAMLADDTSNLIFQIGANGSLDQQVGLHVANMGSANLGTHRATQYNQSGTIADVDASTRETANDAINIIDDAINQVSATRADLGALQNRLEHSLNNLGVTKENLQAAESSIRDVDMAKEMMEFTKNNILVQASQAMLAQANQLPQGVLQMLR